MPLVAYTSAAAAPTVSQVDATYDLAVTPLGGNVQLYGGALGSAGPHTWLWKLLDQPPGSTAALNDPTLQDPTLVGVDVWGNFLLMLVATDTLTAEVSETDPRKAPPTAFVVVRVLSAEASLQKPAIGERRWAPPIRELVDVVEGLALSSAAGHTIASHSDVAIAEGADLDVLVGGGYAYSPDPMDPPATALHKHAGTHVDVATTTTQGTIKLEEPPADPLNPKAITRERMVYQGNFDGTLTALGYAAGVVEPPAASPDSECHVVWYFPYTVTITRFDVFLSDGGDGAYEFRLVYGSQGDVEGNTMAIVTDGGGGDAEVSGSAPAAHAPLVLGMAAPGTWTIAAGTYVGLKCSTAPATPGGGGSVQVHALRQV